MLYRPALRSRCAIVWSFCFVRVKKNQETEHSGNGVVTWQEIAYLQPCKS